MKKKIVAIALAGTAIALLLTACGKKEGSGQKESVETQTTIGIQNGESDKQETSKNTEEDSDDVVNEEETSQDAEESGTADLETQKRQYTYTDMELMRYAKTDVNVRDLPSTDGTKLGVLKKNQKVLTTGTCNETGWYRISYNGGVGYVSNAYLVGENELEHSEPQETEPAASNQPEISGDEIFGMWDSEGISDGEGMYTGRSTYTNELFGYGLTVPNTAKVFGMDSLMKLSSEGIVKTNQVLTGDEKGVSIGVSACTTYQKYDTSSELNFLQARQTEGVQSGYKYSEIDTVTVGKNKYYYVEEQNSSGSTSIYLVKKFSRHMLEITFSAETKLDLQEDCLEYLK